MKIVSMLFYALGRPHCYVVRFPSALHLSKAVLPPSLLWKNTLVKRDFATYFFFLWKDNHPYSTSAILLA